MSELNMVKHSKIIHDSELRNQAEATGHVWSDLDFIGGQITVSNPHTLLHRNLIQLFVVVYLRHILWLRQAIVVQEWRVIVWDALLVLHVTKNVEKILVVRLGILKLLWEIVFEIAIRSTLAWLVHLVALGAHGHDILNALLYH